MTYEIKRVKTSGLARELYGKEVIVEKRKNKVILKDKFGRKLQEIRRK